jgi:hypothetical protein
LNPTNPKLDMTWIGKTMKSGNSMSRMDIGYELGNQQECIGYHEELRWWHTSRLSTMSCTNTSCLLSL